MTKDVLDDDDRVVDDQADRGGDSTERHDIERFLHAVQQERGNRNGDRDDDRRNKNHPPVLEKDQQDENRQHDAQTDAVPDRSEGLLYDVRLIVEIAECNPRWYLRPEIGQSLTYVV